MLLALAIAAAAGTALGLALAASAARRRVAAARAAAGRERESARAEVALAARRARIEAAEQARGAREAAEAELGRRVEEIARMEVRVERGAEEADARAAEADARERRARDRRAALRERERELGAAEDERRALAGRRLAALERTAGEDRARVRAAIVETDIEEARADAAAHLRALDADGGERAARAADRLLEVVSDRCHHAYLTERVVALVPVARERLAAVTGESEAHLRAIEEVAGGAVRLSVAEGGEGVRLEGPDGLAREVARRTLDKLAAGRGGDVRALAESVAGQGRQRVRALGRRAFEALRLPPAHPEILDLVGRLNWRTSYTQNQWKHAVEAGHLGGMLARELGLDTALARRGALLHDIGKSLTPQMEGSHALIGADIARRLGEPEEVANAIAAHHHEEPFRTPYAPLVAAADALSGGRPGARREQSEGHERRIEELERVASALDGVESVWVVSGGRELRVQVRAKEVDDAGVAALSEEIARRVSAEVVFPGQIRVTVIRRRELTQTAG